MGLNPEVFGAVTRAIELGIPTEDNRIREFVRGALDNAGLPVAKASAALSINAGQARLRDIVIKADGADLQATVNVDLADAMLDALLTLNAPPSATGARAAGRDGCAQGDAAGAEAHGRYQSADELVDAARRRAAIQADRSDGAGRSRGSGCRRRGCATRARKMPNRRSCRLPRRRSFPNADRRLRRQRPTRPVGHQEKCQAPPLPPPVAIPVAEASGRAARRKRCAGTGADAGAAAVTRLAELTSPPACRSGRA